MNIPLLILLSIVTGTVFAGIPDAADYASLQDALTANPGRVIFVPQALFELKEPLRLTSHAGITGYGTLVQTNPDAPFLAAEGAEHLRIQGVTLSRPAASPECNASALDLRGCRDVLIEDVRIVDNRSQHASIALEDCKACRVTGCEVRNYKCIAVDDRTAPGESLYGYAFHCIDGTGITVRNSMGISLVDNRIIEDALLPTRDMLEKHHLGELTEGKYPSKPGTLGQEAARNGRVSNWHQGSAIVVTDPEKTRDILIRDNHIENCAQGIDLHCDYVRCADNTVKNGMIGIKMTHGSRHLVVSGNLLSGIDLWGIIYNPGAASHGEIPATADAPAKANNSDGGSVIANNIITDFGRGHEFWNWGGSTPDMSGGFGIALYAGQLPENPPLSDVLLTGNMVCHTPMTAEGDKPRYSYALYVGAWDGNDPACPNLPKNITVSGNAFHPGSRGLSNVDLPEIGMLAPRP